MRKGMRVAIVGRFQPYHWGHYYMVERALELYGAVKIILGSVDAPRTIDNPWTAEERRQMIRACHPGADITFGYVCDSWYDDVIWALKVRNEALDCDKIVGFSRDNNTTLYQAIIGAEPLIGAKPTSLSGTRVREAYFDYGTNACVSDVPPGTYEVMQNVDPVLGGVAEEWALLKMHCNPVPRLAADAVVLHDNHVLMVKRGGWYGNGLLALPGGFVESDETLLEACERELKEETGVSKMVLNFVGMFDHPKRDHRGRVVSAAFWAASQYPINAKAGDDAAEIEWVDTRNLAPRRSQIFSDHFDIIEEAVGQYEEHRFGY